MAAILGGLGAAVAWACSALCSSRSSRMVGPASVLAWVAVIGLVITVPLLVAAGDPDLSGREVAQATGRIGHSVPVAWAVLPPRIVGVAVIAIPLIATRRLRFTRPALPLLVTSGCVEVAGFAAYSAGARSDIAVAAVLASLFGVLAALIARVLLGERLARPQATGVTITVAGVVALSVLQA
jgi:drug/metabolite transporter (DMT)-like permease